MWGGVTGVCDSPPPAPAPLRSGYREYTPYMVGQKKFTHRQRHETKKSFRGLSIFTCKGRTTHEPSLCSFTRVLHRVVASPSLLFGDTHTHTYNLPLAFMCPDLVYLLSLQSSPYLGSVKITIRVETTFLFKTQLSLSPMFSL